MLARINNAFIQPVSVTKFIITMTLFNIVIYHYPLFSFTLEHVNIHSLNGVLTFFAVLVSLFVVSSTLMHLMAFVSVSLLRAFSYFMIIGNSIALYFLMAYHVILDRTMMGNVFNTNQSEVWSYYNPKIVVYLIVFGIVPAFILTKIRIEKSKRLHLLKSAFIIAISGIVIMYLNGSTWLWGDKYSKTLGGLCLPWSYSINAIRYKMKEEAHSKKQILLPAGTFSDNKKTIVVLVIGESARAKDFSLYGYDKKTNPELEKLNVIALPNSFSSATYTTASIHSMLSYEGSTSDDYEPLPNYLQRMGADVIWRSRNWGEPVLKVQSFEKEAALKTQCQGAECDFDGVMLSGLAKRIEDSKKDKIFIVLHMAGSHGPTYYTKYPSTFERFTPVCKTVSIKDCTPEELVNAYDNTIVYTDHFLAEVIGTLKHFDTIPSSMIYISDHGESLGEYGLYLHGTPYTIAPEEQKKVPFIIWESDSFLKGKGVSSPFVKSLDQYGQNNIFHTVLGALGLSSPVYNKNLDLFSTAQK